MKKTQKTCVYQAAPAHYAGIFTKSPRLRWNVSIGRQILRKNTVHIITILDYAQINRRKERQGNETDMDKKIRHNDNR